MQQKQMMALLMVAAYAPLIWAADVSKATQPVRIGRNPIVRVVTVSQAAARAAA